MTWIEIEAQWAHLSAQAKSKWAKLSDRDLTLIAGNRARLIGKLEKRYGLPVEDGELHVDEWSSFEATPGKAPEVLLRAESAWCQPQTT